MPRKPRIHLPGGFYHIILRGNARQDIYFDSADRIAWQALLEKGLDRYEHRVHAYCWMTNHVHMALQAGAEPLARFMTYLASNYARRINCRKRRSGHLFERRYRAILVQEDSYLKELVRYIHMNPIRARMVERLSDYRWSSHHAYAGHPAPDWLTCQAVMTAFGPTLGRARHTYLEFMGAPQSDSMIGRLRAGNGKEDRVLGDDNWRQTVLKDLQTLPVQISLEQLVEQICRQHHVTAGDLESASQNHLHASIRAEIGLAAADNKIATLTTVAHRFNRSPSTLSRAVENLRRKRKTHKPVPGT
jgi:putative transposase